MDREIELIKKASEASVNAWNHLKKKLVGIIDVEKVGLFLTSKVAYKKI